MRIFKNKFFIIALAAALILATCATVFSVMGVESPFRSIVGTIFTPFRWVGAKIAGGVAGFFAYFTEFDRLSEENAALREENAVLQEELAAARADIEENDSLREYMGLSDFYADMSLTDAQIIGRESGSYMTVYTLNRGTLHGIKSGMPVITAAGVVGYVRETGLFWCKVIPITETIASVGVYVERSGAAGIAGGDYALWQDGLCRMTYIEDSADIEAGDIVITSGTGTIYPAGLVVGVVREVVPDEISRSFTAVIIPSVDFENLSRVMIITDYTLTSSSPPETSGAAS